MKIYGNNFLGHYLDCSKEKWHINIIFRDIKLTYAHPRRESYRAKLFRTSKGKYREKWWAARNWIKFTPWECITVIFMKTVTINSCGELVTAGHGTRGIGFKYGKMKGLKISPPQSVARIDHTSFLCANEASSVSFCLPIHHPLSVLPSLALSFPSPLPSPPPSLSFPILLLHRASPSSIYPYKHLRPVRATCHSSSSPSAARGVRACFLVGLRAALETWHLQDSRENSVKRLERQTPACSPGVLVRVNVSAPLGKDDAS